MTPDEQEALSRLYSDDVIQLLPLKSGAVAVFNNARELCGILPDQYQGCLSGILRVWFPPKRAPAPDPDQI
jgi:hypothetical protein